MIRRLKAFGLFWYDFVIGDDWTSAAGIAVALAVTAIVVSTTGLAAWWIVPLAIVVLLPLSLWRAVRAARSAGAGPAAD